MHKKIWFPLLIFTLIFTINSHSQEAGKEVEMGLKMVQNGIVDDSKKPTLAAMLLPPDFLEFAGSLLLKTESKTEEQMGMEAFVEMKELLLFFMLLSDEEFPKNRREMYKKISIKTDTGEVINPLRGFTELMTTGMQAEGTSAAFLPFKDAYMVVFPIYQKGIFLLSEDIKEIELAINLKEAKSRKFAWELEREEDGSVTFKPEGKSLLLWMMEKELEKEK